MRSMHASSAVCAMPVGANVAASAGGGDRTGLLDQANLQPGYAASPRAHRSGAAQCLLWRAAKQAQALGQIFVRLFDRPHAPWMRGTRPPTMRGWRSRTMCRGWVSKHSRGRCRGPPAKAQRVLQRRAARLTPARLPASCQGQSWSTTHGGGLDHGRSAYFTPGRISPTGAAGSSSTGLIRGEALAPAARTRRVHLTRGAARDSGLRPAAPGVSRPHYSPNTSSEIFALAAPVHRLLDRTRRAGGAAITPGSRSTRLQAAQLLLLQAARRRRSRAAWRIFQSSSCQPRRSAQARRAGAATVLQT